MKRIFLAVVLLAFCFGTALYGFHCLEKSSAKLIADLEVASRLINEKNTNEALEQLQKIESEWKKKRLSFNIFLDHTTLDSIDSSLPVIAKILSSGNDTQAFEEIQKNIAVFADIVDEQRISIGNIL